MKRYPECGFIEGHKMSCDQKCKQNSQQDLKAQLQKLKEQEYYRHLDQIAGRGGY